MTPEPCAYQPIETEQTMQPERQEWQQKWLADHNENEEHTQAVRHSRKLLPIAKVTTIATQRRHHKCLPAAAAATAKGWGVLRRPCHRTPISAHTSSIQNGKRRHRSPPGSGGRSAQTAGRASPKARESYNFFLFVNCCTSTCLISEFQL